MLVTQISRFLFSNDVTSWKKNRKDFSFLQKWCLVLYSQVLGWHRWLYSPSWKRHCSGCSSRVLLMGRVFTCWNVQCTKAASLSFLECCCPPLIQDVSPSSSGAYSSTAEPRRCSTMSLVATGQWWRAPKRSGSAPGYQEGFRADVASWIWLEIPAYNKQEPKSWARPMVFYLC